MLLISGVILLGANYLLVRAALPPAGGELPNAGTVPAETKVDGSANTTPGASTDRLVDTAQYRADVLNTLLVQSGLTLVGTAALALLLGRLAANRMLRQVHGVVSTARTLSADSMDQRIRMPGPRDELTELADTFDDMLDRLADSFDSQRRFVANASHELRTPLATQRTMIEVAIRRPATDDYTRQLCHRLLTMNERSESLIEGLLMLASSNRGLNEASDVRIDALAEHAVATYETAAAHAGVQLSISTEPCVVRGDAVLLERLICNLVDNGIKYNNGGWVSVRVGGDSTIVIANTGPEVPPESVHALFEPFRQLTRARTGTDRGVGLGLSIVASIVRAHDGTVHSRSRDDGGLEVTVSLR
ncbi:signal transduction histidine kinase [Kibdelosporangium banguiense]|uniref:histidine kinase n=1 Tax=Kibdelosporangium banguiense TaxID=1365924 RepID=A0ABS4T8J5_9PSEU|nr:HAMP domain-containing sensor histidine kinase [Kibdelosporangium banguiense]MBP2320749.1 signal transduction histidine kinase [Kibdelosporangium banguiense]